MVDERAERCRRIVVSGVFTVLAVAVVGFGGSGAAAAQPGATDVPADVQPQDIEVIDSASALGTTVGSAMGSAAGAILGAGVGGAGGCVATGLLSGVTIPVDDPAQVPSADELEFTPSACITGGLAGAGTGAGLGGTVGGPVGGAVGTGTGALVGSGLVIGNHLQAEQSQERQVGRHSSDVRSRWLGERPA